VRYKKINLSLTFMQTHKLNLRFFYYGGIQYTIKIFFRKTAVS